MIEQIDKLNRAQKFWLTLVLLGTAGFIFQFLCGVVASLMDDTTSWMFLWANNSTVTWLECTSVVVGGFFCWLEQRLKTDSVRVTAPVTSDPLERDPNFWIVEIRKAIVGTQGYVPSECLQPLGAMSGIVSGGHHISSRAIALDDVEVVKVEMPEGRFGLSIVGRAGTTYEIV